MSIPPTIAEALSASTRRKLRPGEGAALGLYIQELSRQAADAKEALRLAQDATQSADYLALRLDGQGKLSVTFPGSHAVAIPSGATTFERGAAMDLIVSLLRERGGKPVRIGTSGAPLQSEIPKLLAQARGKPARRVGGTLSPEDLQDLEIPL